MCEKKIQTPFEKILITENTFPMEKLSIFYGGPSIKEDVTLASFDITENMVSKISFQPTSDICVSDKSITTTGDIKIEYLRTGPYQTLGGTLEFRRLFFHFKDLVIHVKIKFIYNSDTVCTDASDTKLLLIVDKDKGVNFDTYFATDGTDITNINELFYDLDKYFKNYSSNFGVLFDILLNSIIKNSELGKLINNELIRIICDSEKQKIPAFSYIEKLQRLNQRGDIDIIIKNKNNFFRFKNV
jgi:hypothetical protein